MRYWAWDIIIAIHSEGNDDDVIKAILNQAFRTYGIEILKTEICTTGKWAHEICDVVSFFRF